MLTGPGRNNLLRRAGAAFDKFGKMLEAAPEGEGLGTALGKEIASVLLKVLLPNPLYCQRGTVTAFQSEWCAAVEVEQQQEGPGTAHAAWDAFSCLMKTLRSVPGTAVIDKHPSARTPVRPHVCVCLCVCVF